MSKFTRTRQRLWLVVGFAVLIFIGSFYQHEPPQTITPPITAEQAFEAKKSDVQLEVSGRVIRILDDDNQGSRHQRFILELASGQTLLVAHNIDLAPRIAALRVGDEVSLNGEYEWNRHGGMMHWTHHDPANRHIHGWIRHQSELYQ